ncbi:8-amino-7-oxononanoate synthase [Limnospira fusiformis]|uniref:8-amino-7-oxononanoate synthase n=1 Tax=Limnospira fusiformis TaxID=54297 RepID=UPI002AA1108C|nr:8-amino-7-oxononanoate synthase [Limnospira fusiformis LS22]
MVKDAYGWMQRSLNTIHQANWYRSVTPIASLPGPIITVNGREMLNFASNDYLGLAGDKRLIEAAMNATREWGTGTTGSRLLTGHRELHRQLELAIANLKNTEDAIVFSSGYLANIGTISALVNQRDIILSDEYNHSSLKMGAKLSGATVFNYPHSDINHLTNLLKNHRHQHRRSLIITDTLFSMDGDLSPLPQLVELAQEFDSMLLVDEAHATGVFGKNGAGCVEYFHLTGTPLLQMGTLSKALGSLGGYVAGSATAIDFLRNRAPSWIYTTGLTPADTAAALTAIKIVQQEPQRRAKLWENVATIQAKLKNIDNSEDPNFSGFTSFTSPILCYPLKNAAIALQVAQKLQQQGIFAPAIRPPTVTTSRLRISLMATHEPEHIDKLIEFIMAI